MLSFPVVAAASTTPLPGPHPSAASNSLRGWIGIHEFLTTSVMTTRIQAVVHIRLHESDREGIERLCRYGARGPLTLGKLSRDRDDLYRYRMKRTVGGRMRVISVVEEPPIIGKILRHLGLPHVPLPTSPARGQKAFAFEAA